VAKIPGPAVHGTHYHDSPDEYLQILASGMNRDGTLLEAWTPFTGGAGYQRISGLSAATALTVPAGAKRALVQVLTQNVYYRDDGGTVSTTNGMRLDVGGMYLFNDNLSALRFIQEASTAELRILYYKD
jgi:hypothetical protein